MHVPDGLLDLPVLAATWAATCGYAAFAIRKSRKSLTEERVPVLGVLAAVVFAFQMLNFPISAGTSGHLLGFVLVAALTTPTAAFLVMFVILAIQALMFADGGVLSLGANVFNMGVVTLLGYWVFLAVRKRLNSAASTEVLGAGSTDSGSLGPEKRGGAETQPPVERELVVGGLVGGWVSVVAASLVAGVELGASSAFPYGLVVTVPVMLGYHVVIGLGEGLITAATLAFFSRYAPEHVPAPNEQEWLN
ncbi:MAG: energy-coupling factor ABC transporter permease [Promethearchaeota archaeon]